MQNFFRFSTVFDESKFALTERQRFKRTLSIYSATMSDDIPPPLPPPIPGDEPATELSRIPSLEQRLLKNVDSNELADLVRLTPSFVADNPAVLSSLLCRASQQGNLQIVDLLCQKRADVNVSHNVCREKQKILLLPRVHYGW